MIYDKLKNVSKYEGLGRNFELAAAYIRSGKLSELGNGSYQIAGTDVFVNIFEYDTIPEENSIWEGHRVYADLHIVLRGEEKILCGSDEDLCAAAQYDPNEDFIRYEGVPTVCYEMRDQDFLIAFPGEVHKPKVILNSCTAVRKAVVKIKVK